MSDPNARPETGADDLLAGVPADVEPPTGLRDQVIGALRAQGLLRGSPPARPALAYRAMAVAAAVVAFLGGRATVNDPSPASRVVRETAVTPGVPGLTIPEGSSAWTFLLYEDGRFDAGDLSPEEVARAYDAWRSSAAARGVLLLGEKFADEETLLVHGEATTRPLGFAAPAGMLGGMFVVAAPTRDAALALARETPHHEMGGIVLMREIDRRPR